MNRRVPYSYRRNRVRSSIRWGHDYKSSKRCQRNSKLLIGVLNKLGTGKWTCRKYLRFETEDIILSGHLHFPQAPFPQLIYPSNTLCCVSQWVRAFIRQRMSKRLRANGKIRRRPHVILLRNQSVLYTNWPPTTLDMNPKYNACTTRAVS